MHILQVTPYFFPHFGGVESHVLGLSENLIKMGHDVEVVTSRYSRMPETETLNGIRITRLPQWINMYNTPIVTSIRQFVRRTHADIIHIHSPPPFTERFAAKGAKEAGKPFVVTHHCDLELKGIFGNTAVNFYQNFLGKFPLEEANRVISTTESYATTSRTLWDTDVTVIPNAVDIKRFNLENKGELIRDKYSIGNDPLALFVGRLVPHKGIGILIRSLTHTPNGKLMIVGDGPYKKWLMNLVKKLDLNERVIFVGPVDDYWLPSYYSATDVVILPSTSRLEAFGIVGLEGMASGKPLILSDIPGVRDVISEKEGYIVEPLDPNAIAEALEKIWSAPEMAREMGKRGRERVEALFSWEKVSKDVEEVFNEILTR
ncbi:MAG: glycosyltransferase family 4 protein [Candidatus Poseidoniales archaeon]|tara:strand:+ start:491 stop:1612 length:1122 start_codon:yes stop_codon:yes gene_type:complete